MKKTAIVLTIACVAGLTAGVQAVEIPDASLYVGTKKCKMCHKKEDVGAQFTKWEAGPHSKAFESLASDKAKEVAAKMGIDDPQASGKCLKCHSSAYNFTEEKQTDAFELAEGVSCESCHGAGANYKKKDIMKDRAKAIAGGMIYPAKEKMCTVCHTKDGNPTWDETKYKLADGSTTGFDVEQAYEKMKHERPE